MKDFFTKNYILKTLISAIGGFGFLWLANFNAIFFYIALPFLIFLSITVALSLVYAWILNPIRNYKTNLNFIKIKKEKHYPSILKRGMFPIVYFKDEIVFKKNYKFTKDSIFIFGGDDRYDWSKLFGISFKHHHKNSYRFGFRFLNGTHVGICKYIYEDGIRRCPNRSNIKLKLNKEFNFEIKYNKTNKLVTFSIYEYNSNLKTIGKLLYSSIEHVKTNASIGYTLGMYLGGNKTFNKDIKILKRY